MQRVFLLSVVMAGCGVSGGGGIRLTDGGAADGAAQAVDLHQPGEDLTMQQPTTDLATPIDFTTPPDLTQQVAGPCAAGRYAGPATVMALANALPGTITFTLGPAVGGVLPVTKGTISAASMSISATADVTGSLDCNQRKFTGMLQNGVANALGMMLPFTGTLGADYDIGGKSFQNGVAAVQALQATGTWTAAYLGP